MNTKKNKKGFTLVELMIVAIIVAILAAVVIPLMAGSRSWVGHYWHSNESVLCRKRCLADYDCTVG